MINGSLELTPGINSRRDASAISGPIELLFINESTTDPTPTPPHPSTLKPLPIRRPTRAKFPFSQVYVNNEEKLTSVLLNKIIGPLEELGVVSETTTPGTNLWQGWVRVPKKGESWELKNERINGVQKLNGDFHRVNIVYVPSCSWDPTANLVFISVM